MRRRLFLLGVLLHAAVLVFWGASLEYALAGASRIRLETAPIDPRDLLRGDYIRLNFKVSDIPMSAFDSSGYRARPGDRVYVSLRPTGGVYELAAASLWREALPVPPGHLLLAGRVEYPRVSQAVHVLYGIERYYVPEGKGTPPRGKIEAEVALTKHGRPLLTRIFVDGRAYP